MPTIGYVAIPIGAILSFLGFFFCPTPLLISEDRGTAASECRRSTPAGWLTRRVLLLNSAAVTGGDSCLDPVEIVGSSCDASGNADIALRGSPLGESLNNFHIYC